jgi:predicted transcriptional regulator
MRVILNIKPEDIEDIARDIQIIPDMAPGTIKTLMSLMRKVSYQIQNAETDNERIRCSIEEYQKKYPF